MYVENPLGCWEAEITSPAPSALQADSLPAEPPGKLIFNRGSLVAQRLKNLAATQETVV